MSFRFAAGLAIIAFAVAAAAAAVAIHNSANNTAPATPRMSIEAYQTLMNANAVDPSIWSNPCDDTHHSGCGADASRSIPALQKWLDALKVSNPPDRFAVINTEMRQQLSQSLTALHSLEADSQRGDNAAMTRDYDVAVYAVYWTGQAVPAIMASQQIDATAYRQTVMSQRDALDSCATCQLLFNLKAKACVGTGGATCVGVFDDIAPHFDAFEAVLVQRAAPPSLASQDARLQSDLERANSVLLELRIAAAANDAARLNSLAPELKSVAAQVDQDAARITG